MDLRMTCCVIWRMPARQGLQHWRKRARGLARRTRGLRVRAAPRSARTEEDGIVICGAGIVGAAIAHSLARRGVRCTVVESRDAVASGTTAAAGAGLSSEFMDGTRLEQLCRVSFEQHMRWKRQLRKDVGYQCALCEFGLYMSCAAEVACVAPLSYLVPMCRHCTSFQFATCSAAAAFLLAVVSAHTCIRLMRLQRVLCMPESPGLVPLTYKAVFRQYWAPPSACFDQSQKTPACCGLHS
jgi:FAD dependent oxidoreductase